MLTKSSMIKLGTALAIASLSVTPVTAAPGDYSGSAYDPSTNRTTTISKAGGVVRRQVENGNTLERHRNDGPRRPVTRVISGSMYDPETNTTTTLIRTPRGDIRGVRPGR